MTLRERLLDAVLDGDLGHGLVVTRQELIDYFHDVKEATTGVFLSNSEIKTGKPHSPNYNHFTQRLSEARYRIHPSASRSATGRARGVIGLGLGRNWSVSINLALFIERATLLADGEPT